MSKALDRAALALKTSWDVPGIVVASSDEMNAYDARVVAEALLDPDDKHLADAVIYPIKRALARDWFDEDLPTEIITALRDAILGSAE